MNAVNIGASRKRGAPAAEPYHHGSLRPALIEEGLRLLESGEHAELSLRELARRVGVSANAAYRHFADKEALLEALATEGFRQFGAAQMDATRSARKAEDRFRASGRAYVRFAQDRPALFRLMFGRFAARHRGAELTASADAAYAGLRQGVASTMGPDASETQVTIAAIRAWSLVHGLSHLLLDGQFDEFADRPEALVDAVLLDQPLPAKRRSR